MAYKSNLKNLQAVFYKNIDSAMEECGVQGTKAIKSETPVLSGDLKKGNRYEHSNYDSVDFINDVDYAAHVELGTYKMSANPFLRRGLLNNLSKFRNIIFKHMKI